MDRSVRPIEDTIPNYREDYYTSPIGIKYSRKKAVFGDDQSALIGRLPGHWKSGNKWTRAIKALGIIINDSMIQFEDRCTKKSLLMARVVCQIEEQET